VVLVLLLMVVLEEVGRGEKRYLKLKLRV